MSKLVLGTNFVSMDEGCWSLSELNMQAPDSKGWHRYQFIKVIRGDKIATMCRDLGLAQKFEADQRCIPGGVVDEVTGRFELLHTVGELVDIADLLRSDRYDRPEKPQPTDLIQAYREQPERRQLWRKKRSMVGPLGRVQRG